MGDFLNTYGIYAILLFCALFAWDMWKLKPQWEKKIIIRECVGWLIAIMILVPIAIVSHMNKTGQEFETVVGEVQDTIQIILMKIEMFWSSSIIAKIWNAGPIAELRQLAYWIISLFCFWQLFLELMWLMLRSDEHEY